MSGRIERPNAVALLGGALVMLGAWLPWLTLFAGLQRYGGFIGVHGRMLFVGGGLAVGAGISTLYTYRHWVRWGIGLLGVALVGFTAWLLGRLAETLRHGVSPMLAPRAGPGLFVSLAGATLVVTGAVLMLVRGRMQGRKKEYRYATPRVLIPNRFRIDRIGGRARTGQL